MTARLALAVAATAVAGVTTLTVHKKPAAAPSVAPAVPVPLRVSRGWDRPPLHVVKPAHFPGKARHDPLPKRVARPATVSGGWAALAECESSGDWHANTGNGFYGGVQFTQSTWTEYGGLRYAPRADLASPLQQVAVAARVLRGQGPQAWPVCSRKVGWR